MYCHSLCDSDASMSDINLSRRTLLTACGGSIGVLSHIRTGAAQTTGSAVSGPTVYATVGRDYSHAEVKALNAATGEPLWTFSATRGQLTAPVADQEMIYVGSQGADTDVVAMDAITGDRVWDRTDIDRPALPPARGTDQLVVAFQGTPDKEYENRVVQALNKETGATLWRYEALEKWVIPPVVTPERVFIGSLPSNDAEFAAALHALDPATGERLWRTTTFAGNLRPPVIAKTTAFVSAGETLYALDVTTGAPRWELADFSDPVGKPVIDGEYVLVTAGATLTAVERTTGNKAWTFTDAADEIFVPSVTGEVVIAGDGETLYAIDRATGTTQWQLSMPHGAMNTPAVAANTVYVGGEQLLAVDLSTGEVLWSVPAFTTDTEATAWSTPLLRDPTTAQSGVSLTIDRPALPLFVVSAVRSPTGSRVAEGDPTVRATIANHGTARGTTTVAATINSEVRTSQEVSLGPGEETTVTFTPGVATDQGAYLVGVRTLDDRERADWQRLYTDDVTVKIGPNGELGFGQERLAVRPDTTLRFRWESPSHNLVVDTQPAAASLEDMTEIQGVDHTVERTLTVPGKYRFICQPHQAVGGILTVLVVAEAADNHSNATADANTTQTENTTAAESASSNMSAADDSNAATPGFGVGVTAASIAGASYLAGRRALTDEDSEM